MTKESHVSVPIDADTEYHLKSSDDPHNSVVGKKYVYCHEVICSSVDEKGKRYKPIGKPYIEDVGRKK